MSKKNKWQTEEDNQEPQGHPSQDTTSRFAMDQLIRSHGWQIISRRRRKDPVWVNNCGVRLTQDEVLMTIPEEQIRIAEELELNYYCF